MSRTGSGVSHGKAVRVVGNSGSVDESLGSADESQDAVQQKRGSVDRKQDAVQQNSDSAEHRLDAGA